MAAGLSHPPTGRPAAVPRRRALAGPRCVFALALAVLCAAALFWALPWSAPRPTFRELYEDQESSPHALLADARHQIDIATPHVTAFAQQDNVLADGSFDTAFVPSSPSKGNTTVLLVVWSRPHHGRLGDRPAPLGVATATLSDSADREVAVVEVDLAPATATDWTASWKAIEVVLPVDMVRVTVKAGAEHEVRVDDVRVTIGTSQRERAGIAALIATLSDAREQETLGAKWECGANQCSGRRFFQVWSTHPSTFTVIQLRSIESILRHHPNACVCVYAEELPVWWFSELWYYGHNVRVGRPSPEMISQRIPVTAPWAARIKEWRKGRNWYAHYADWLRLALLYLYGGTYTDTDYVFLRELGSDGEPSTNTTCTNAGGAITGTPPWSVVDPAVISRHTGYNANDGFALNNAFLSFDKGNKFLVYALEHISKIYRPRCWDCHGPRTVTHIYKTRLAEILARSDPDLTCVPSRVGRLQPTFWKQAKQYVLYPEDELFAEVVRSSTAVHLWNRAYETDKLVNSSFAHKLLERSRITLFPLV
eukprot:m51a1_g5553 hypothetical protein (538) ;mRNA; r:548024-549891